MTLHIEVTDPKLPRLLDKLLRENADLDAELERRRRERNEEIFTRAVRNWFASVDTLACAESTRSAAEDAGVSLHRKVK